MNKQLIKTMAVSSALSILLLYGRIQWSANLSYVFLAWNLFLAWIPFVCSLLLKEATANGLSRFPCIILFFTWLLFFPNSPYIVTDLFHLHQKAGVPLWFDLVLILSFAWNGLLLGYASLLQVQQYLSLRMGKRLVNVFTAGLMVLCSFGIYLGRYPRWNSWDIINDPFALFADIFNRIIHPFHNTRMIGVTFFFSLFLMVSYWSLVALIRNFKSEEHE